MHTRRHLLLFLVALHCASAFEDLIPREVYIFQPDAIWPFCGRIYEDPPTGWNESQGCPPQRFGMPDFQEEIRSTFGPRPLKSDGERYDFHRGIDISAPEGSPMFAIADGKVEHWGVKSGYTDPVIILEILRPGETSCGNMGCYHALYLHARADCCTHLTINQAVKKGDFLGSWQQDCIHPLHVLPYRPPANGSTALQVAAKLGHDGRGQVEVILDTDRKDIRGLGVKVLDAAGNEIDQPGNTPNAEGYNVHPSVFDFETWNRQWSHKDSSTVQWEAFDDDGGDRECPFRHDHGATYSAHYHLDAALPGHPLIGLFNGITVALQPHAYYSPGRENSTAGAYYVGRFYLNVTWLELHGVDERAECIEATAVAVDGWNYTQRICREGSPWPFSHIPSAAHSPYPWGGPQFNFSDCKDGRSWEELFEIYSEAGPEPSFVTGGLGRLLDARFEAWACMRDHPCLASAPVGAVPGDWMCFAYDEVMQVFEPWYMWPGAPP